MITPLLTDHLGEMHYSEIIPPALVAYLLKEAIPRGVSGPYGQFLFQEIRTPESIVWYNNYLLPKNNQFLNNSHLPKLELQFGLSNSIHYTGKGLGKRELHDGSFNLIYVPHVDSKVDLRSGRIYTTFDVYLTPVLMHRLALYFPILDAFLGHVAREEAVILCVLNQLTTRPMTAIIDEILDNPHTGSTHAFYVANKVVELLIVMLERVTNFPTLKKIFFRDDEIRRIYEARDELLKNLDKHFTLLILSRKVGLNVNKLKTGFMQFYGSSVTIYRLHARMKEARILLNSTSQSIEDIGYTTGYANSQHFSKVYKKYYGHTPARSRKEKEECS